MAHIPDNYIVIQPGCEGRIVIRNSDGCPKYFFDSHADLYSFVRRHIEAGPCSVDKIPYSNKRLHSGLDPEKVKAALADHDKFVKDFLGTKFKEVITPMKHTDISKTIYIFAKEWDFSWSENEYLVARRNFEYRDDLENLLSSIREADYIMLVPDDRIQDTARFVQVTGYDVHYELGDNDLALNMSVTHA